AFHVPTTASQSQDVAFRGVIADNMAMGFGELADNNTQINTSYDNCVGLNLGGGAMSRAADVHYSHCTFVNWPGTYTTFPVGVSYVSQNDPTNLTTVKNSILTGIKGPALSGIASEDYNVFFGNNSDRSSTPTGTHSIN